MSQVDERTLQALARLSRDADFEVFMEHLQTLLAAEELACVNISETPALFVHQGTAQAYQKIISRVEGAIKAAKSRLEPMARETSF